MPEQYLAPQLAAEMREGEIRARARGNFELADDLREYAEAFARNDMAVVHVIYTRVDREHERRLAAERLAKLTEAVHAKA